jgi:hypothetical protein
VHYLYIKRNVEKVWGVRYTLGARYLSKNTVFLLKNEIVQNVLLYYLCYVQVFLLISYFSNGVGEQLSEESCGG